MSSANSAFASLMQSLINNAKLSSSAFGNVTLGNPNKIKTDFLDAVVTDVKNQINRQSFTDLLTAIQDGVFPADIIRLINEDKPMMNWSNKTHAAHAVITLVLKYNRVGTLKYLIDNFNIFFQNLQMHEMSDLTRMASANPLTTVETFELLHSIGFKFGDTNAIHALDNRNLEVVRWMNSKNPKIVWNETDVDRIIRAGWLDGLKFVVTEMKVKVSANLVINLFKEFVTSSTKDNEEKMKECFTWLFTPQQTTETTIYNVEVSKETINSNLSSMLANVLYNIIPANYWDVEHKDYNSSSNLNNDDDGLCPTHNVYHLGHPEPKKVDCPCNDCDKVRSPLQELQSLKEESVLIDHLQNPQSLQKW